MTNWEVELKIIHLSSVSGEKPLQQWHWFYSDHALCEILDENEEDRTWVGKQREREESGREGKNRKHGSGERVFELSQPSDGSQPPV